MPEIKFSHQYVKMDDAGVSHGSVVKLDRVQAVHLEDLSKEFLEYDTRISMRGQTATVLGGEPHYKLPKTGAFIKLNFWAGGAKYFCTLRRYTPAKFNYYSDLIYREFKVVVK